jgi:hypothetical protein
MQTHFFSGRIWNAYYIQRCVFIFVISDHASVNNINLTQRDGLGIQDANHLDLRCTEQCEFLITEMPINQK